MYDRVPTYPGRVELTDVETGVKKKYDLTMADEPLQEGTPPTKGNLLTDETARRFGLEENGTVNDALYKTSAGVFRVGDVKSTFSSDLGETWEYCNGRKIDKAEYPELYKLFAQLGKMKYGSSKTVSEFPDSPGNQVLLNRALWENDDMYILPYLFPASSGTYGNFSVLFLKKDDFTALSDVRTNLNFDITNYALQGNSFFVYAQGRYVFTIPYQVNYSYIYYSAAIDGPWKQFNVPSNVRITSMIYSDGYFLFSGYQGGNNIPIYGYTSDITQGVKMVQITDVGNSNGQVCAHSIFLDRDGVYKILARAYNKDSLGGHFILYALGSISNLGDQPTILTESLFPEVIDSGLQTFGRLILADDNRYYCNHGSTVHVLEGEALEDSVELSTTYLNGQFGSIDYRDGTFVVSSENAGQITMKVSTDGVNWSNTVIVVTSGKYSATVGFSDDGGILVFTTERPNSSQANILVLDDISPVFPTIAADEKGSYYIKAKE